MLKLKAALAVLGLIFLAAPARSQDKTLTETIIKLDSIFFGAYNHCDLETQAYYYSDSIEFYHDKGGLTTSKKEIMEAIRNNICGKVTRELVKGSIEVSPIPGYGAIEMGLHMFHNNQEKDQVPHPSKFIIIWRNQNNRWSITRVISLH
ncbi:MAG: nuclear transport factor 2 family protein [Chitinophagaceae bacterium]|nr:nuclear transport factor 2 family protein [Chitinophagaceae bacterium]